MGWLVEFSGIASLLLVFFERLMQVNRLRVRVYWDFAA
jgi:hypothetical protein